LVCAAGAGATGSLLLLRGMATYASHADRGFMSIFERLANQRLWPLFVKELRQIARNRRLVISLIIPPTIQIIIFGVALNPEVTNLRLGVVDSSRTAFSRELVSAFVESRAFAITSYYSSSDELGNAL